MHSFGHKTVNWSQSKQAKLCNKLRIRRHLLHKRRAWPRRLTLTGPLAWRGFPLFSCFNIEPCNNYLIFSLVVFVFLIVFVFFNEVWHTHITGNRTISMWE